MANENETFEQVCEELRAGNMVWLADRILAVHKCEIAAKDDERLTVAANYEAVIAAKDRIIEAKDREIARLKEMIDNCLSSLGYCKAREVCK